jgi:hypothetical protein
MGTPKSFHLNKNQVEIFAKTFIQQTNKYFKQLGSVRYLSAGQKPQ